MDPNIHNGRWTTSNTDEVVLFVVGIRINNLRAVRTWLPVLRAMRPMLRELTEDQSAGLLGYRAQPNGVRELTVFQYWNSIDQLMNFAHAARHKRAWQDFYRKASRGSDVGIWHETFVVPAGSYEAIYGNVPKLGLAEFRGLATIGRRGDSARARLGEPATRAPRRTPDTSASA
jgi:Domain of unknown function (DUF4188)